MKPLLALLAVAVIAALLWLGLRRDAAAPSALDRGAPESAVGNPAASTSVRALEAAPEETVEREPARGVVPAEADEREAATAPEPEVPTFRVRVVDPVGRAVEAAPVELRLHRGNWHTRVWLGATGADGLVEVQPSAEVAAASLDTSVALAAAFDPEITLLVDLAQPPPEPVELVLPPAGRVHVRVTGAAPDERISVELAVARGGRDRVLLPPATADVVDGIARFDFVGLGLELEAIVSGGGGLAVGGGVVAERSVVHAFRGPTVAGQTLEVAVDLDSASVLTGLLVDEVGAPVGGESVSLKLVARIGGSSTWRMRTARTELDGRFRFQVEPELATVADLTLGVSDAPGTPAAGAATRSASVPVPAPLGPGATDLGRVVLRPTPLLVAGHVVDDTGRPIADADVWLERATEHDGERGWRRVYDDELTADTDAAGRFAIHGELAADVLRVHARHREYMPLSEGQSFAPGAAGVRLVLPRGASLAGALLVDGGLGGHVVRVVVESGGRSTDASPRAKESRRDFRAAGLAPGLARVVVGVETAPELAVVEDVALVAGETCTDERLDPLDLRGRLSRIELEVVTPDGSRASDGDVWLLGGGDGGDGDGDGGDGASGSGGGERVARWSLRGQPVGIVKTGRPLDLSVLVPGYRPIELRGVESSRRVELEPGLRVRLRLAGASVPEPPFTLSVRLTRVDSPRAWGRSSGLGSDGTAELAVSAPGEYRASWKLTRRTRNAISSVGLPGEPFTVRIHESTGEVEVPLDPEALREAMGATAR